MNIKGQAAFVPAFFLLLLLLPFTWVALSNTDLPQFGRYQDDGLFLIGAKSLHDLDGYRISSLPGRPYQTKYQPMFSALLSPVWMFGAAFPANLRIVAIVSFLIALSYFVSIWWFARSQGYTQFGATAIAGSLALSPWLVYWALVPVSDFLFALLTLGTFQIAFSRRNDPRWWWVAGGLGAAAYLTKVAGILLVPAILLGSCRRKDWKRALIVSMPIVAACAAWTVWAYQHRAGQQNSVLWYYTDYLGFHVKNGGIEALLDIVSANWLSLIAVVGNTALFNLADSYAGRLFACVLVAGVFSGAIRFVRRTGAVEYPVFCAMLTGVVVAWNFSPNPRLLAPVLPMVAIALFEEASHVWQMIQRALSSQRRSDRVAGSAIRAAVIALVAAAVVLNVRFILTDIPQLLQYDRAALNDTRRVFDWCRKSLPPNSVVLVENDTFLHLYAGFQTVRPVPNSVAFYKRDKAGSLELFTEIDRLTNFFGVTHILLAPGDWGDFDDRDRVFIRDILERNPRHRTLYREGSHSVLAVNAK